LHSTARRRRGYAAGCCSWSRRGTGDAVAGTVVAGLVADVVATVSGARPYKEG